MSGEIKLSPESEAKKDTWLKELANFIVEANTHTWAADGDEVEPQRPGYKELRYPQPNPETGKVDGDWELRDSYTGYFRAPGMTTIYYKGKPAWTMAYGGRGMEESKYPVTKPTFMFLMAALMKVTPELPFRGPREYVEGKRKYQMEVEGNLEDFHGQEEITENGDLAFTQIFFGGIVISKTPERTPLYPWER